MQVSPRDITRAVSDGTGRRPEEIAVLVAGAAVLTGVILTLRAVDLVMRYRSAPGRRS
jgi:hypothetical protein